MELKMSENVKTEKVERIQVNLIDQKMRVTVKISEPSNEQDPPITLQDVLDKIKKAGVGFGVNETIINQYIEEKKWEELFIAAEGIYPGKGEDAKFEYNFLTTKSLKPHISEDGRIDYKEIDAIGSVSKDDILVKKIPATKGLNGKNVYGNELAGTYGKDINVVPGPGTYKDPKDAMLIKASADGVISFNPNTLVVEVQKLYVIPGSVDFSTGNVNVKSSVDIYGDVKSGFTITTPYDINVKGRIEHAAIACEGNLTVKGGIVGDGKQIIKVGGDIHSGYIRDHRIICSGGVYAGTEISNSIIECGDEVTLVKPDGKIIGGKIIASNKIIAGSVGNKYNVPTLLEVGMNFEHREKYLKKFELITDAHSQAETIKKKIDIIDSKPPDPGMNAAYKAYKDQHKSALEQWEKMCGELKEIEKDYFNIDNPVIIISKTVYYGVTIKIKHFVYEVKQDVTHVMFKLNGDQIECSPLK
jgi:hypothetical protein